MTYHEIHMPRPATRPRKINGDAKKNKLRSPSVRS